ncbi:hypothetical protein D3C81_691830 [compost metagenome]
MDNFDKLKMTVELNVTIPQALALQSMFEYWNELGDRGSSRSVTFFVDGDGNFKPDCTISFDGSIPKLTNEIKEVAISSDINGDRSYDFDALHSYLDKSN